MSNLYSRLQSQLFLLAGPCAVEQEDTCMQIAETVKSICERLDIVYVFKASYRKANQTRSALSYHCEF